MTNGSYERLFSVKQVALILNVDETTIRKWINKGSLPALKVGKLWRIRKSSVDALLNQEKGQGHEP